MLTESAGHGVRLHVPVRGEKRQLVELAASNARHALEDRPTDAPESSDRAEEALFSIQDRLDLKVVPRLIICFDVSHTQGAETVASAVVFETASPSRPSGRTHSGRVGKRRSLEKEVATHAPAARGGGRLADLVLDGGRASSSGAASSARWGWDLQLAALAKREEVFGRTGDPTGPARPRTLAAAGRNRRTSFAIAATAPRSRRTIRSDLSDPEWSHAPAKPLARFIRARPQTGHQRKSRVPGFQRSGHPCPDWLGR